MNRLSKILFWTFSILLGFVNPLISVALVVIYYLPKIIQDFTQSCNDVQGGFEMKSYADDILVDMK